MHNNLIPYLHKAWGEGGMEWYYNYTVKETYKLQVVKERKVIINIIIHTPIQLYTHKSESHLCSQRDCR